jgi:hypothetical protein
MALSGPKTLTLSRKRVLAAPGKSGEPKTSPAREAPSHLEVYRVLALEDATHAAVLAGFRASGGDGARWRVQDVALMATAITAVEDVLELKKDSATCRALRARLQDIRRRLEDASGGVPLPVPYAIVACAVRNELGA